MSPYANHSSEERMESGSVQLCLLILVYWHRTLVFKRSQMSDFIPGQINLSVTCQIEVLAPKWDKLCRENNVCCNVSGVNGCNHLVLVSHTTSKLVFGTCIFKNFKQGGLLHRSCCSCWYFACSSINGWYSNYGSRELMPQDIVSSDTLSIPLMNHLSEVNCIR